MNSEALISDKTLWQCLECPCPQGLGFIVDYVKDFHNMCAEVLHSTAAQQELERAHQRMYKHNEKLFSGKTHPPDYERSMLETASEEYLDSKSKLRSGPFSITDFLRKFDALNDLHFQRHLQFRGEEGLPDLLRKVVLDLLVFPIGAISTKLEKNFHLNQSQGMDLSRSLCERMYNLLRKKIPTLQRNLPEYYPD